MMGVPILVDYRENKPYTFPGIESVERTELNVGDYTLKGFEDTFAVERKTFDDLATSVGSDRLRFENEIRRANGFANQNEAGNPLPGTKPEKALDEFIVIIEASRDDLYRYKDKDYCPHYYSRIHPNSVIGTVESWPQKYDTLEFVWAGNREQAMEQTLAQLDEWYLKYITDTS
jgi:hypothetical protein